uniref:DUF3820 family protein n=1 Tax=Thaumasiovibrio occultus TaxID=1891184 RepID=UPI000B35627D|nr:DUF3820 family protein [Thaumasiovibrio occultus]
MLDKQTLLRLANTKIPFGKYAGCYLVFVPEEYLLWFEKKGFPPGELGEQLAMMLELKRQGVDQVLVPLIRDDIR